MAKHRFGVMPCEGQNCESHSRGAPVVVFRNERDTLSYSCDWCGRSPYARPGTGQYQEWLEATEPFDKSLMTPGKTKAVDPDPAPVPVPPPAPVKRTFGTLLG